MMTRETDYGYVEYKIIKPNILERIFNKNLISKTIEYHHEGTQTNKVVIRCERYEH